MLDKLFSDEKIFRIFTFCSIVILFFIVLRKNKKEGFTYTSPTDAIQKVTFKADVEEALGENIQAIKNLGEIAGQLLTSNSVLDLSSVDLKVKSLDSSNVFTKSEVNTKLDNVFTKLEVNSKLAGKLNIGGGTLTGPLTIKSSSNAPLTFDKLGNSTFFTVYKNNGTKFNRFGWDNDKVLFNFGSHARGWENNPTR